MMSPFTCILLVFAYILGILTCVYWHLPLLTPFLSNSKIFDQTLISFPHNTGFKAFTKKSLALNISHGQENNLIMGAALNIPLKEVYRFSRSARYSCHYCTIILLVSNSSAHTYDFKLLADVFNLELIIYENFLTMRKEKAFQIMEIHSRRWILYNDYLQNQEKLGKIFDNVFFSDVRDSVFQTNVFNHMDIRGDGLYAFLEDGQVSIAKQISNAEWIKACYGNQTLQTMGNKSISCSGTVLGSWSAIITYLRTMTSQLLTQSNACLRSTGNDQGIHNFIVHEATLPSTKIHMIPHETGFVGTVGLPNWLKRNKFGLVLNTKMEVYAVVHQLDRSRQLISQYDHEFQVLSDGVLNKKS